MRQAAIEKAGRILAEEAKRELIDGIDSLIFLDVTTAAQFLGISRKSAVAELPTKRLNSRTTSVRLSDFKAYAAARPAGSA